MRAQRGGLETPWTKTEAGGGLCRLRAVWPQAGRGCPELHSFLCDRGPEQPSLSGSSEGIVKLTLSSHLDFQMAAQTQAAVITAGVPEETGPHVFLSPA